MGARLKLTRNSKITKGHIKYQALLLLLVGLRREEVLESVDRNAESPNADFITELVASLYDA